MAIGLARRIWGAPLLLVALILAIGIFGAPARYAAAVSVALTALQLVLIGGAAGSLALPAWRSRDEERHQIAVIGLLLIMLWALLTLMPGYGPPFAATLSMNHVRFIILFISTMFLGAGFLLLKNPLSDQGDRLLAARTGGGAPRHARSACLGSDPDRLDHVRGA